MAARIHFRGPAKYRAKSASIVAQCIADVTARRAVKGPRSPGWNWHFEVGTAILKRQLLVAFNMADVNDSRRFLDSVVVTSPALRQVEITPNVHVGVVQGSWFVPKYTPQAVTMLYLHGGGYSFNPKAYADLIAAVTVAANARTFALDYRLSPEYRFPAQLEDVLHAYRWLLEIGTDPGNLVIAGDSAGGNLTLALLLSLRDASLPLPALAIALSPATDFEADLPAIVANEEFDWISPRMLLKWRDWYCDPAERTNPLVSPIYADLSGLPPVYIQAGRAGILYDSIQAFADYARQQHADVTLESWAEMNHVFQAFGHDVPQSAEALQRIGEVIEMRVRGLKQTPAL